MAHGARDAFLKKIIELIKQEQDIYIVTADLGAPCLDEVKEKFPQRLVNVGIAEQNMISVACGMALVGKKVIAYTSNPFTIIRAYDQIRNAVANMKVPLVIVGIGAGFSISEYGSTHYAIDDYNIMRVCPNIQTVSISDKEMAIQAAELVNKKEGTFYLRFDKNVEETLYGNDLIDFEVGFRTVKEGKDIAIITFGNDVKQIVARVKDESWKVIDLYGYPFDEKRLCNELKNCDRIITIEENLLPGGLGSSVIEALQNCNIFIPVKRYGLDFKNGFPQYYGSSCYLRKQNGIDIDVIIGKIEKG